MKLKNHLKSKTLIILSLSLIFFLPDSPSCAADSIGNKNVVAKEASIRAQIDPELAPSLQYIPEMNITRESVTQIRSMMNLVEKSNHIEGISVAKKAIDSTDAKIRVYIYEKENATKDKPGLLWIHGGGYIMGKADDGFAKKLASEINAVVVSVDYRLAPEHPFPAGQNDCYAAFLWMVDNAEKLGIDRTRIAVGGASAGAGMTAGLVLRNRDEKGPPIAFQFLLYSMLDNLHDTSSGSIENYPVWNRQTSFNAWEMYLGGTPGIDASPYASPTRAKDLSGLPPTFIAVGTVDLFRDENIDYAQRLMAAGVPTELAVFPGMFHGGESVAPEAEISKKMTNTYLSALNYALNK